MCVISFMITMSYQSWWIKFSLSALYFILFYLVIILVIIVSIVPCTCTRCTPPWPYLTSLLGLNVNISVYFIFYMSVFTLHVHLHDVPLPLPYLSTRFHVNITVYFIFYIAVFTLQFFTFDVFVKYFLLLISMRRDGILWPSYDISLFAVKNSEPTVSSFANWLINFGTNVFGFLHDY
jgi:hypothetical protein